MDKTDLTLQVTILTPKQLLFEGKASSVSSVNSDGKFDILAEHANFITLVENQPIEVMVLDKGLQTFNFTQAIIYNSQNKVSILAEPLSK